MFISFLIRPAIFALLALSLVGCGKADLSRSSAKNMIEGSQELKNISQNIPLNAGAVAKARALGILNAKGALTVKGIKLFSKFDYAGTLVHPANTPKVDVTGVTAVPMDEGMKEVQFDVVVQLPPEIKRFAAKVEKGTAYARRYDDGWRIEKVNLSISQEPYAQTPQEQSDEQAEMAAAAAERAKLRADLEKIVKDSQIPKKEIMKFSKGDTYFKLRGAGGANEITSVILHDTEISVDAIHDPKRFGLFGGGVIHFPFKVNSYLPQNQCILERPGRMLSVESYTWSLLSDSYDSYPNQLYFLKKETCLEFKQKFEEALQNWRTTYAPAYAALAEMQ